MTLSPNTYSLGAKQTFSSVVYPLILAFAGGVFAILGSLIEEFANNAPLLIFLVGPAIEEILKPSGVIWLFEKRKSLLRSRAHIIILCMIGALSFATLENIFYLFLYFPRHSQFFLFYRLTMCTMMHMGSTLIVALGLCRLYTRSAKNQPFGENFKDEPYLITFELEDIIPYIILAVALHGSYNLLVYILQRLDIFVIR